MALVNQTLKLEITPGGVPPKLHVTEYDENMQVVAQLFQRGQYYEIPSGTTAKVEGTLAGHPFSADATVDGSNVTFELTKGMTAYAGRAWTKIKLTKDSKPVSTCGFWLECDRAGVEAGDVIGAPGFDEQIKDAVDELLDEHGVVSMLRKVIDATCDIETVSGGNYNLLKVSEVSFSSRLQDNVAGIVSSTATNIVTGWIPVRQGKYYAVSALVDGIKDAAAGAGRYFVQRINVKKADGTILAYNKYPTELLTELSRGKAYSVPADATHMMFHIQIQDRTPQSLYIDTSAKLKAFEPMIVEGDTAALAVSNSIDFAYVDGDADVPAIVNYTLKHDTTKEDKVSLSPYYRNVDYHMMPTSYYKGVGTDYDTTFGQNTSYSTFITAWKTLITGHGGYVTETELGNASDNQKIYLYDFKPSRITNQRTNMPKIVIVACQHGTEKSNVYGLYYFVKNLLNKWNESPVLEYLRNHVEIMIIPVLNTYGFDHFAYKNANGVNLNRNYDANWVLLADTTSDQYGGAAPFDQPETQIVRDLLLDNDDASLVVDFHTNGNGAVAQYSYINYYGVSPNSDAYFNRLIDAVAHQLASISSNFNLDYSLNQPDTVFGWLNNANGVGLLRDWASDNGFASVLVEGFNGFPNGTPFIGDVYKANEEIIANWLVTALNYLKG